MAHTAVPNGTPARLISTCPACRGPGASPATKAFSCYLCGGWGWVPRAVALAARRAAVEAGPLPTETHAFRT